MPTQAPKEKPPTQQATALGFKACIQSKRGGGVRQFALAVVELAL